MSTQFLLTSFVVVATPGTGVVYTVGVGLARGKRASIAAAVGCTFGIVPHMVATIVGLATLLHESALAFQFVKCAGVAYLLYLAWTMWREHGTLTIDERGGSLSSVGLAVRAFAINILNPKLSIFFVAFLPQFIDAGSPHTLLQMLELSGAFMAMTLLVFVLYGLLASSLNERVVARPRSVTWMNRAFAGVFVALGVKLATTSL